MRVFVVCLSVRARSKHRKCSGNDTKAQILRTLVNNRNITTFRSRKKCRFRKGQNAFKKNTTKKTLTPSPPPHPPARRSSSPPPFSHSFLLNIRIGLSAARFAATLKITPVTPERLGNKESPPFHHFGGFRPEWCISTIYHA